MDDPGEQLKWFEKLLKQIEEDGGAAMVLAHIPPGKVDCMHPWSIRLRALQDRFQNVIRFSIHGHSHEENYNIV